MDRSPVEVGVEVVRRAVRRAIGRGRLGATVAAARRPCTRRPVGAGDVVLEPVELDRLGVLANLVQLYRHDMAELRGYALTEDGTFPYPHLDAYVGAEDREALFVRVEGRLAGFVLTRRLPEGMWQISEHFVSRSSRGRGVGRIALAKTFALHAGRWTCFVDDGNEASMQMCTGAVQDVGGEGASTTRGVSRNGFPGTVFRFAVPAGVPTSSP